MQRIEEPGATRGHGSAAAHERFVVVFDLDGTLLNTLEDIARAANKAMKDLEPSHSDVEIERVRTMVGDGARILMQRMMQATSARREHPLSSEELDHAHGRFMVHYADDLHSNSQPYPGVMAGLMKLVESRDIALVVCTNKPEVLAQKLVAHTELAALFSPTARYVTGAVPGTKQKPHPDHVHRALRTAFGDDFQMNPARTVVVGDGHNDIEVAHALGCRSVAVTYGFGDERALAELKPTAIVQDFAHVISVLQDWIGDST